MTEEAAHPSESLPEYAMGTLAEPDVARIERHLATCLTCASVLGQYRAVVSVLPMGLDPVAPPPAAWAAIRAQARQRRSATRSSAVTGRPRLWRRARWPVLTTLVASLLIWNVVLQRELTRRAPGPAPGPDVEALSRRPGRLVILAGTGQPGASARLFVAVDGGGHLAVSGLTPLPGERIYQLWFIRADVSPMNGGTFRVDPRGLAWVKATVPATLDDVRVIAVTEEPSPGSAGPTGRHLLEATTWR